MAITKSEFQNIVEAIDYTFRPYFDKVITEQIKNEVNYRVLKAVNEELLDEVRSAIRRCVREHVDVEVSVK